MFNFPDTEKKLRSMISRYKSAFTKEKKDRGYVRDGAGNRYLLFCLYLVLNDLKKSQEYFVWYKKEFPDDVGEPIQKLCWALSLHRMKKDDEAKRMLAELMLSNLYLIPNIIGKDIQEYNIWHSSNYEQIDYVQYIPSEVRSKINETEIKWITLLYSSFEFRRIRKRYIEIYNELLKTKEVSERTKLLDESDSLLNMLQSSS